MTHTNEPANAAALSVPETITPKQAAWVIGTDPQTTRNQILVDMKEGTNEQNFNAFKVGRSLKIPARWFWNKLTGHGVGKEFEVDARFASWMIRHGLAVGAGEEANDQD